MEKKGECSCRLIRRLPRLPSELFARFEITTHHRKFGPDDLPLKWIGLFGGMRSGPSRFQESPALDGLLLGHFLLRTKREKKEINFFLEGTFLCAFLA